MASWKKKNKSPGDRVKIFRCDQCGRRRNQNYDGNLCATCIRRAKNV